MRDDRNRCCRELGHFSSGQINDQRQFARRDHEELLRVQYQQVTGLESGYVTDIDPYLLEKIGLDREASSQTQNETVGRLGG